MGTLPGGRLLALAVARFGVPLPPAVVEPTDPEALPGPGLWSARHGLRESEADDRPAGDVTLIDSGPPLRAFARPRCRS